jgi:hypothetical protein
LVLIKYFQNKNPVNRSPKNILRQSIRQTNRVIAIPILQSLEGIAIPLLPFGLFTQVCHTLCNSVYFCEGSSPCLKRNSQSLLDSILHYRLPPFLPKHLYCNREMLYPTQPHTPIISPVLYNPKHSFRLVSRLYGKFLSVSFNAPASNIYGRAGAPHCNCDTSTYL